MPPTGKPMRGALQQSRVFYTPEWTKAVDQTFQEGLVRATINGFPSNEAPNRHAITTSMELVNQKMGTAFTYKACLERYRKLRKRFNTFSWIRGLPGVEFNRSEKTVTCSGAVWDYICRVMHVEFVKPCLLQLYELPCISL